MKLKELTSNKRALKAFGSDGTESVTLVGSDHAGHTYAVNDQWFFFQSNFGKDAISKNGKEWTAI